MLITCHKNGTIPGTEKEAYANVKILSEFRICICLESIYNIISINVL